VSKIVLDTNVVIAAFAARGLCESVFELCLESHDLVTSDFLLSELKEKLSKKLKLPKKSIQDILAIYLKNSELVTPTVIRIEECRDPNDIPVIGTCVEGKADFLISGDKDLLVLKSYGSTKIVSPREFYESQK
jgi:putative PIN family toxin of toxin-antitoxin system